LEGPGEITRNPGGISCNGLYGRLPPKVVFFRLEVKAFTRELKYTTGQEKHPVGIRGGGRNQGGC